ncbi:Hypothetical predicted protein, partial [Podarcis lilfordi]
MESDFSPSRCGSSLVKRRQHRRAHAALLGVLTNRIFHLWFRGSRSLRDPSKTPTLFEASQTSCLALLPVAAASRKP